MVDIRKNLRPVGHLVNTLESHAELADLILALGRLANRAHAHHVTRVKIRAVVPYHNAVPVEDQLPFLGAGILRVLQQLDEKMPGIRVHPCSQQLLRIRLAHRLGGVADHIDRAPRQLFAARIKFLENPRALSRLTQFRNRFRPHMRQPVHRHRFQIPPPQRINAQRPRIGHVLCAGIREIML